MGTKFQPLRSPDVSVISIRIHAKGGSRKEETGKNGKVLGDTIKGVAITGLSRWEPKNQNGLKTVEDIS